jgi:Flp pilus assembly protein TadG
VVEEFMNGATKTRTLRAGTRGQSLVEFALVLPMLFVVAFIITEFGRALWIKNALTEAAGAAGRAAIVTGTTTYQAAAQDAANHILVPMGMGTTSPGAAKTTIVSTYDPDTHLIKVTISRPFNFIPGGPLPTNPGARGPFINLTSITISSETTMDAQPGFGT